eukprot:CAMPEP_0167768866 /NCGR_PEP_ID=MMETSP0110_2-20121227/16930_1 /TAXON_ID=629695 /ORGANISM="Gymnochlora sp., Strain CCMP2014" /LENGTH=325 /DNA_ID=CAMNT_0007657637 /DNA_START=63 /DNA_END=1040 /DNA_ORIENTATION=-
MTFQQSNDKKAFGWMPVVDEKGSHEFLNKFVKAGGNFIDTADAYASSEEVIGRWITDQTKEDKDFREKIVLASKVFFGPGLNTNGLNRRHILKACDASLKRLQVDYIDLYQVHTFDYTTTVKEVMSTMKILIDSGKISYWGVSNWKASQIMESMWIADKYDLPAPVCLQHNYSLMSRNLEWEILPVARRFNLAVISWSPLQGGWLTGKYKKTEKPGLDSRVGGAEEGKFKMTSWSKYNNDHTWNLLAEIEKIAKELKVSQCAVSLRWNYQSDGITCPIIGVKKAHHLEQALEVMNFELSADQMKRLNDASEPQEVPYPHQFLVKR